jgi:hypothetical protein
MEPSLGPFFHGTSAALVRGDLIAPGYPSNYGSGKTAAWVYVSGRLDIAVLAAELAAGDGQARVYVVEPTGAVGDDPNVTDKRFPGNPTQSFRTKLPLRVVGEVIDWAPTPADRLQDMRAAVERMRREGIEAIE